jgi:ubiquinone/menaquinone biosynthesis C-methylase UbiE
VSRARILTSLAAVVLALGIAVTVWWFGAVHAAEYVRAHAARLTLVVAVTAGLTTANLILRWLRWNFLIRRFGVRVPTRESVRLYFATLAAIATPFYVGELVRAALLAGRFPQARRVVAFVWAVERVTDAMVLLLFLLVARGRLGWATAAAGGWMLLVAVTRRLARGPVLAVLLLTSITAWMLPILALGAGLRLLDEPVPAATAADAMASGTLLGGVAGVPLGTGITGSTTILVLERHGTPPPVAAAAVAAFRAGTAWYAVGLGLFTLVLHRRKLLAFLGPAVAADHFSRIAAGYEDQIPPHVRERLLGRKVAFMRRRLQEHAAGGAPRGARGLDVGCGHGWYACEMAALGYEIEAIDRSADQIAQARRHAADRSCRARFTALDAERLPWPDATFDFAYSINVIHHVTTPEKRQRVLEEIVRVLKPGGVFFLHEINTENPLFRFYMGYFFPLLCEIDEGTEEWVKPSRLPPVAGARWASDADYFTFLPDFTPRPVMRALAGLEARLERSPLRRWSAHYIARLEKPGPGPRGSG